MPTDCNTHLPFQGHTTRWRKPREESFNSILIVLSVVGVALVLLREVNYGVGLGSDSRGYVATARSLLEGNWFTTWSGEPMAKGAPLFPAVLAFFGLFGLRVITAAAYVNAIAFGLIILTTTIWLKNYVKSRLLIVWTGCAIALFVPLADLSSIIMTDTLFILFTILSWYTLDRFIVTNNRSIMILSATYASLAWLTRYQGAAFVATALLVILAQPSYTFPKKIRQAIVYATITGAPIAGWFVRNLIVTRTFAGVRTDHLQYQDPLILDSITSELVYWTLGDIGSNFFSMLSETLISGPETGMSIPMILFKTGFLLAMAFGIIYLFVYLRRRGHCGKSMTLVVPVVFIFIYVVSIIIPPILRYEGIYLRYLIPLYIPLLVVVVLILGKFLEQTSLSRGILAIITAVPFLWLAQHIPENYRNITERIENGFGAASKAWDKSETLHYLKKNPLNGRIFTTHHWVVYFSDVCTEECTLWPIQYLKGTDGNFTEYSITDEPIYVVVIQHDYYYTELLELTELPTLEVISTTLDGMVMRLAPSMADIEGNKVLNQDMIADMVLSNPDRFDGRLVLDKLPLELR